MLVKVQGIHVSWVIVGALELVYWYVWAAYTPLMIGLALEKVGANQSGNRSRRDP